jgi:CubicO group peptidase (beta-lactamase class C family)
MLRTLVLVAVQLIASVCCADQPDGTSSLDSFVDALAHRTLKDLPHPMAMSIGVFTGKQEHFFNYGSVAAPATPPTRNTLYEIGSVTKTFTSYVLANAVLEKRVKLDDDIRKYLTGAYPNLEYDKQPIRIVDLADTTSGLPELLPPKPAELEKAPADTVPQLFNERYARYSRKDFFAALHEVKLTRRPGAQPQHSNAAAQLLAYILEDVYQTAYDKLLDRYVLSPFAMKSTGFVTAGAEPKLLADGHGMNGHIVPRISPAFLHSAGGLVSSTSELLKYLERYLDRNDKAAQLAVQKRVDADGGYGVGLNWLSYRLDGKHTQIWTDGTTFGFCSYVIIYPEIDSAIVILTNFIDVPTYKALPGLANEMFRRLSAGAGAGPQAKSSPIR